MAIDFVHALGYYFNNNEYRVFGATTTSELAEDNEETLAMKTGGGIRYFNIMNPKGSIPAWLDYSDISTKAGFVLSEIGEVQLNWIISGPSVAKSIIVNAVILYDKEFLQEMRIQGSCAGTSFDTTLTQGSATLIPIKSYGISTILTATFSFPSIPSSRSITVTKSFSNISSSGSEKIAMAACVRPILNP